MFRACIAVVDATRGRLFRYERSVDGGEARERFVEDDDCVDPQRHLPDSELFSDRAGSGGTGKFRYAFDDHRSHHLEGVDAGFAHQVLARLREICDAHHADRVVVCAGPRMLGYLRAVKSDILRDDQIVIEVPRDLVNLTPVELRHYLAEHHVLPELARNAG